MLFVVDVALGLETRRKVQRFIINTAQCFFNFNRYQTLDQDSIFFERNNRTPNHFTVILYDSIGADVKMYITPKDLPTLSRALSSLDLSQVRPNSVVKRTKPSKLGDALTLILKRNLLQRNQYNNKMIILLLY